MTDREQEDTRALWNRVGGDWRIQVGDDGDGNHHLNADPVLWAFVGHVNGRMLTPLTGSLSWAMVAAAQAASEGES